MLNIIATNSYKNGSEYVYELLSRVDPRNLAYKHLIIVPDRVSMTAEQEMLDKLKGSFNVRVLTFRRFGAEILRGKNYLTKQTALMALSAIIGESKDELVCYTKGQTAQGFIESVYETICNLRYCRIKPDELTADSLSKGLQGKVCDIKLLYEKYDEFLTAREYIDSAGKMEELISAIPTETSVKSSYFYIYDFDNFSVQEQAIIASLSKYSMGVTAVCCQSDEPNQKYLYLNDLCKTLVELAEKSGVKYNVQNKYRLPEKAETAQISKYLYTYKLPEKPIDTDFVTVAACAGINDEILSLARYLTGGVRKGARYGDFFVVASDAQQYRQAIERIFADFDIPYFVDTQTGLINHAYVRFALDYFTMRKNNNKLENVLSVVKNPFFTQSEDVFAFENYCLKYNVSYDFSKFELGKNDSAFAAADKIRAELNELINLVTVNQTDKISSFVAAARELMDKWKMNERLIRFAEEQKNTLPRYAKASEQVAEKFSAALQTLNDVLGDKTYSLDEFVRVLSSGINGINVSVLPMTNDCVVITNMAKSKKHDIKRLCLIGANQGLMPIVKKDTKLLSDKNIDELDKCGISLTQKMSLENKRERFNVYQLLCEPTKSLYVSYKTKSAEDTSAQAQSDFVLQLKKLFTSGGKSIESTSVFANVFTQKSALAETVTNARCEADNRPIYDPYYDVKKKIFEKPITELFDSAKITDNISCGAELFFRKESVSVSKIEDFYACPYQHYLRYGLEIKPREEAELNPNDFGSILHAVLEKYINEIKDETPEETKIKAENHFNEVMRDDYYRGIAKDAKNRYALSLLKTEAVKMCRLVNEQLHHSHFVNLKAEMRFGFADSAVSAIEIPAGGKTIKLHGIIDRIDVKDDRCLVIDYKSGSAVDFSENELYVGKKLQLLVYMCAVAENLGYKPSGYFYFKLHDNFIDKGKEEKAYTYIGRAINDVSMLSEIDTTLQTNKKSERLGISLIKDGSARQTSRLISAEQMQAQLDYAKESISRAGELMENGFIRRSPYKKTCDYCDYSEICGAGDLIEKKPRKEISLKADDLLTITKNSANKSENK